MINLLIKPASGACNLKCKYCFYNDVASKREHRSMGMMSLDTLERLARNALFEAKYQVTFAFQGGEPTLAGLDFFKALIEFEKKYNVNNVIINNSIQTNGMIIDDEWAEFFTKNNFLVGLSLDGDKDSHELHRGESFNRVMKTAKIFDKHNTQYNILCVVTANTARKVDKIYNFYKRSGFKYLQFIPCLDELFTERGAHNHSLTPKLYTRFLINLFDVWYDDFMKGEYTSIRHFDNYIHMLMGKPPESCGMSGICTCYFVVEADGSVYPCDFYVLDQYKIGTIDDGFQNMRNTEVAKKFVAESVPVPEVCKTCRVSFICRNGCKRDRLPNGLNYFCESYKEFFTHALPKMQRVIEVIRMNS
ncbi:MAG: Anaerobic sulfatase-maturating enzyme [Firmicutes bacterium ADurb.Bin193]|nr:MAG: Anaerobic sulfatase-maturating enzyme [Firmicutes bacterium ADurb.Bin193]